MFLSMTRIDCPRPSAATGSARSPRGSAAPGLRSPRRGSAAAGWSSARGRSPASAARRRTACRPCWRRARHSRGNSAWIFSSVQGSGLPEPVAGRRRPGFRAPSGSGKICRPSGTRPMPSCAIRYEGKLRDLVPGEADRAGARRRQAHDGADRRGLAHAVAAEQRHHLAGRTDSDMPNSTWLRP